MLVVVKNLFLLVCFSGKTVKPKNRDGGHGGVVTKICQAWRIVQSHDALFEMFLCMNPGTPVLWVIERWAKWFLSCRIK